MAWSSSSLRQLMFVSYPLALDTTTSFAWKSKEAVVQSIHVASACFGQRKDMSFSSALFLPVDEAEEMAGTAKNRALTINIVLWHMTVTSFTRIHVLLWATHLVNLCKL